MPSAQEPSRTTALAAALLLTGCGAPSPAGRPGPRARGCHRREERRRPGRTGAPRRRPQEISGTRTEDPRADPAVHPPGARRHRRRPADSDRATAVLYERDAARAGSRSPARGPRTTRCAAGPTTIAGRSALADRRLRPHRRGRAAARPGYGAAVRQGGRVHRARNELRRRAARGRLRLCRGDQLQPRAGHHPAGLDPPDGCVQGRRDLDPRGPRGRDTGVRVASARADEGAAAAAGPGRATGGRDGCRRRSLAR